MSKEITGALFKQMILHGAAAITAQKQAINDLNVFPVPDGDTGTNMSMTIATAAEALRKAAPASVGQASSVTASALLQGARGNSGVILSLLFRGLSKALKGMETADAAAFAAAMQEGVAAAYKAVMKPAEGTVLTVSRLAAKRAVDTAAEGADVETTLAAAIEEGYDALAQTTDMNPVLKKAGVVDAGGKGYLLILEGMLAELRGEPIPENVGEPETHKEKADFNAMAQEEITFTFDTVYVVRKAREDIDLMPLRAYLSSIGDSLVIGEDDETFKVHVHTDIPGAALTESQKYGTLELAKVENMRSQADALAAGQTAQSTDDLDAIEEELENGESGHKVAAPEKAEVFLVNLRRLFHWQHHRMWPLFLEYACSTLWAFAYAITILLFILSRLMPLPDNLAVHSLFPPEFTGMLLGLMCLLQFVASLYIERRYEKKVAKSLFWVIWFPMVYWMIGLLTTLVAFPKVMVKRQRSRARWVSPDRGKGSL